MHLPDPTILVPLAALLLADGALRAMRQRGLQQLSLVFVRRRRLG